MTHPGAPQQPQGGQGQQPPAGQAWTGQHPGQFGVPSDGQPSVTPAGGGSGSGGGGGGGRLLAGIVIGLVVAVIVGAVLALTDVLRFGSEADQAADGTAIELPAELAGLKDQGQVAEDKNAERAGTIKERNQRAYALTTEWYQRAFDGAGVGVRTYADTELEFMPTVIAIRAGSPGLTDGPVVDPADLGLEVVPGRGSRITEGDVECLTVSTMGVREGEEVDPEELATTVCRRANSDLTVYVHGNGRGPAGQQQMIEVTDAAFEAVAGTRN